MWVEMKVKQLALDSTSNSAGSGQPTGLALSTANLGPHTTVSGGRESKIQPTDRVTIAARIFARSAGSCVAICGARLP